MARRRVSADQKVFTYPIGLRHEQIRWLDNNPEFNLNKFIRDKLDEYIETKKEVLNE